ncbi:molecular chaperone DnaK [Candidatus Sumerlaeota bacterium]|nr:molecular chaperone DnaK [Candidatus Sumerlaeota bacterium]
MAGTELIVGIDFGTTNSVVAVMGKEVPNIISNTEGQPKTPSTVAFLETGEVLIGEIAQRQAATQPHRTISSIKRLMGRFLQELHEEEEVYPFEIGEDENGRVTVIVDGKAHSPQQISAMILVKLKEAAEDYLGGKVEKAIITVPAYFDDIQRQATLEAAKIAGLEVPRLINEPTAAAMAYGLEKETPETVAIYDFGGGTFDFSVLDIDNKTFEVLTSEGNSRLGGDDLDMALVDYFADRFFDKHNIDLREEHMTLRRLKDEVERAKCELSTSMTAVINLPFITNVDGNPLHLEETLTRDKLEEIIEPFIEESMRCCTSALKEAGLRKNQITKVILVGGSTRIPLIQECVEEFFGLPPFRGVNPDEVVALGAAMQAAVMTGQLEEVILLDVTPHSLGIEIKGNRKSVLIQKNSTIPVKVARTFTTTEDDQSFVTVHLLQGEEDKASDCRSLGKCTLSDIPEAPAGVPRVRVEMFINADGVVEVSASESHSDQEKKLATSFAHLSADERRARQGLSSGRRRKRKRRRAAARAGEQPRKILEATPSQPRSAPVGKAKPRQAAAPDDTDQPEAIPAISPVGAGAGADDTGTSTGDDSQDVLSAALPPVASESSDTIAVPRAITPIPDGPEGQPEVDGLAGAEEVPAVKIGVALPESLNEAVALLNKEMSDKAALEVYERDREEFLSFCKEHPEDTGLQSLHAMFLIHSKQPEEAREVLVAMRKSRPDDKKDHFELYGLLCRNFPNYLAAKRERAMLAHEVGELEVAMADLEFLSKREESDTKVFDDLSQVYQELLAERPDSTVQFKLVKTYLRMGELDNAITLLQQLVQVPTYRERADKALGLCFWQKGLRFLAFQKFKTLEVDDQMKDTLYRLATEMEENDELEQARSALERIYEVDIAFRDLDVKLKKINYRIELMQDARFGDGGEKKSDSGSSDQADTISESVLGGRFELLGEVNRGSMGIVYKAHDRTLDEIVAIKILNDYLCADPQAVERFKREARSARKLSHPNIVRIHDFFNMDDRNIISMEFIEGEDLKAVLTRNMSMTEDVVINYLRQIAEGLGYAHSLGVVHRDIKPANIMINEQNSIKITDFGIAKVLDTAASKAGTMIVGTPLYMAPEQIQGGKIDQRVDIYALGIMLYELVTGSPPFCEGSIEYQHIHSEVPEIKVGIADELKKIIFKCVEKNPDDRYQKVGDLIVDLPS